MFSGKHLHKNESRIMMMIMFIHLETHISSNFVNGGHSTCFPVQYFNCIMGNYQKKILLHGMERGAVAFTVYYMYMSCICTCNWLP